MSQIGMYTPQHDFSSVQEMRGQILRTGEQEDRAIIRSPNLAPIQKTRIRNSWRIVDMLFINLFFEVLLSSTHWQA